jgi:hypothetical protein
MSPITPTIVVESDSDSDSESSWDTDDEYETLCHGCVLKEASNFRHHDEHVEKIWEMTGYTNDDDWCNDCMNAEADCMIVKCSVNHSIPSNKWFANGVCTVIS